MRPLRCLAALGCRRTGASSSIPGAVDPRRDETHHCKLGGPGPAVCNRWAGPRWTTRRGRRHALGLPSRRGARSRRSMCSAWVRGIFLRGATSLECGAVECGAVLVEVKSKRRGTCPLGGLGNECLRVGRHPELGVLRSPDNEAGQGLDQAWVKARLGLIEAQKGRRSWAQQRRTQAQEAELTI